MDHAEIKKLAHRYRKLIDDKPDKENAWNAQFYGFPNGFCDFVSQMFGKYLFERCGVNAKYVSGTHREGFCPYGSHAWLESGELIVDLTCDQFPHDPRPAPYIGKDPTWHSQWSLERTETRMDKLLECDGDEMGRPWDVAYQDLLEQMDEHR